MVENSKTSGAFSPQVAGSMTTGSFSTRGREHARNALALFFFLLIAILFVKVITPTGLSSSPDSIFYLEMAESFQKGAGAHMLDRSPEYFGQEVYEPITIWPPMYPAFLAIVLPDTPSIYNVQIVSAFLIAVTMTIILLLLTRFVSAGIAFLLSILYCITVPVLLNYSFVWSETLFLPLYCGVLWSIVKYLEKSSENSFGRGRYLVLLGILIGALFYTRYSGVGATLILVYVFSVSNTRKVDLPYFFVAGLIFSIPILYLMYSNLQIMGSVTGGERAVSVLGLSDNLDHVLSSLAIIFPTPEFIWLICIFLATLFVFVIGRSTINSEHTKTDKGHSRAIVLQSSFFLTVFYLMTIVILRSVKFFDEIGIRLISPALPVFWVFLCAAIFLRVGPAPVRFITSAGALTVMMSLSFQGWLFYTHIRSSVTAGITPSYPYRTDKLHINFTYYKNSGELPHLVANKFPDLNFIASRKPQIFQFVTGVTAVYLPEKFNANHIQALVSLARPFGLALISYAEYEQFSAMAEELDAPFEVYKTAEAFFVVFNK